jgi:hypothetical protein
MKKNHGTIRFQMPTKRQTDTSQGKSIFILWDTLTRKTWRNRDRIWCKHCPIASIFQRTLIEAKHQQDQSVVLEEETAKERTLKLLNPEAITILLPVQTCQHWVTLT